MNFRLARSIYGKPWLIDSQSALAYMQFLEEGDITQVKNSLMDDEEQPQTIYQKLFANHGGVVSAPIHRADAREHPGYEGAAVAVLPVIGPLMKEDFCGWYGTAALKNELSRINQSSTIKAIVMVVDSPGGTVDGTQALAEAYRSSAKEKITIVDGMMCSAGYWCGSGGDEIILSSPTDLIGCIGTMIAFHDYSKMLEERGIVLREYKATGSSDKNRDFDEARKGNGALLIESTLDPLNDVFLEHVKVNRRGKINEKKTLSGKTFVGQAAVDVGLADRIESMDSVINNLVQKHNSVSNFKMSI